MGQQPPPDVRQQLAPVFGPEFPAALTAGLRRSTRDAERAGQYAAQVSAMLPAAKAAAIARFARTLRFSLHVPGTHYPLSPREDAMPHDALLDLLAVCGRDFRADTPTLRAYIRFRLASLFVASRNQLPAWQDVEREVRAAVLTFVVARLDGRVTDTPIAPNAPRYAAWKRARWPNTRPGIRTSQLRNAIALSGQVTITGE